MKIAIAIGTTLFLCLAIVSSTPVKANSTTLTFVAISPTSPRTFFYGGSTIPFKFQLFDSAGNIVSTATATIWVDGQPGTTNGNGNTGNSFKFDPSSQLYIYNLSTKNRPVPGPNSITIMVSDGSIHTFVVTFH